MTRKCYEPSPEQRKTKRKYVNSKKQFHDGLDQAMFEQSLLVNVRCLDTHELNPFVHKSKITAVSMVFISTSQPLPVEFWRNDVAKLIYQKLLEGFDEH